MLAGCGGSQPPIGAPGAMPQTAASQIRKASSSSGDLLYVGSYGDGEDGVSILTYPQGQIVAQFQPNAPNVDSLCADTSGDVFVGTNDGGEGFIYEYAHEGTTPIATLDDPERKPVACSVDPTTGNLAVVSSTGSDSGNAVVVYPDAQYPPIDYTDPTMDLYYHCAYDDDGNLFVSGEDDYHPKQSPKLTELPAGGSSFSDITLNKPITRPGSVQWLGSYLALSDLHGIHHIDISGTTGTIVGKTVAEHLKNQWLVHGSTLISPYGRSEGYPFEVAYWKYPKGGKATQVLDNGFGLNVNSVAISVGSSR
jgi:hypothetical protein